MKTTKKIFISSLATATHQLASGEVLQAGRRDIMMFGSSSFRSRRLARGAAEPGSMAARHPEVPSPRNVDPSNTYNSMPESSHSRCSPDYNGYFGMAAGETRYLVKYQYGLETAPNTKTSEVLYAVDKAIESILLNTYFPSICTDDSGAPLTGVSGFRFDETDDPVVGLCSPLVPNAVCNIHEGTVEVSGAQRDIPDTIERHLGKQDIHEIHPKIVRLFPVHITSEKLAGGGNNNGGGAGLQNAGNKGAEGSNLSGGAIAGIVLSTLLLVVGLSGLYMYDRRRKLEKYDICDGDDDSNTASSVLEGELALDRALEEALGEGPFETIDLSENTSMLLEGNRPTSIFEAEPNPVREDFSI